MYGVSLRTVVPPRASEEVGRRLYGIEFSEDCEPEGLTNVTLEGDLDII